jgi:hypothetical protein
MAKLVINQEIRALWLVKGRGVFGLIVNISIVTSFLVSTWDIFEGMPSYPLQLVEEN